MKRIGLSESALRRRAVREGYKLVKSRKTGLHGLKNLQHGGMDFGWDFDATLEDIAAYLSDDESAAKYPTQVCEFCDMEFDNGELPCGNADAAASCIWPDWIAAYVM
jgi:hypothetical protein